MPRGTVIEFDEYVGLGEVRTDGGDRFLFHCVEIADGSRTIEVGAEVEFELRPYLGRYQAEAIAHVPGGGGNTSRQREVLPRARQT